MFKSLCLYLGFTTLLFIASKVHADSPVFDNIDQEELDSILKEISANFAHVGAAPAKGLGKYFGLEAGVIGGATKTPKLNALVQEVSPNTTVDSLPHGGIYGAMTIPWGITFEYNALPTRSFDDVTVQNTTGALRWNLTHFLDKSPLHLAVKAHYGESKFAFVQNIQNSTTNNIPVTATINFKNKIEGALAILSAHLFFFEPYVGAGYVRSRGKVKVDATGSATIFSNTISQTQEATTSLTASHLLAGIQFDFFFLHLAAEYSRLFGADKVTGKISLAF